MRMAILMLGAAVALCVPASAAPALPPSDPSVVDLLNAERVANGIPAVLENAAWSAACADHVAYMAAARSLTHVEDPRSTRYTASGSWAGENSVVAEGSGWGTRDPFASAPLHLIQLMTPELRRIGFADGSGYLCVTTWPGYGANGRPAVYTYPGDGATGVPYEERAHELPFVPGDFVGLPRGTATGFNLMVFAEGVADRRRTRIVSATLTGPEGRVVVKTVDRTTPTVGTYLPPGGGFVIPVAPLRPGTTYRASVRFASGLRHTWSFTTAGA
jgi:hypothetical protein